MSPPSSLAAASASHAFVVAIAGAVGFAALALFAPLLAPPRTASLFTLLEGLAAVACAAAFFLARARRDVAEPVVAAILAFAAVDAALHLWWAPLRPQPSGFVLISLVAAVTLLQVKWFSIAASVTSLAWSVSLPTLGLGSGLLEAVVVLAATQGIAVGLFITRRQHLFRLADAVSRERAARAALEAAARDAARAHDRLTQFSSMAAHDLRAPMRSVALLAELARETAARGGGPELDADLRQIQVEGKRGAQLVDGLLAFARASDAEVSPVVVDITDIARRVERELRGREPARAICFDIPEGLRATVDPVLAETLFRNLLGNAWKHTATSADVTVRVRATRAGPRTTFVVEDDGPGFDPARVADVFEPFVRVGTRSGSGLGLATARRIVERHGGRIEATSAPGRGAAFTFDLPAAAEPAAASPKA